MVRRSHWDGLGSASQAPRDRASGTNGATDVPVVGQRCGTQGPGPGPVKAWPVMAGGGVWVCSVTLTWFLLVWEETQEPGLRVTTCSGGLSATALYPVPQMGRRGALGQPPPAWRERRKEVIPWCTVHHSPPLETQRLRKLLFIEVFGYRWLLGQRRNKKQNETKDSPPGPPPGEGVVRSPSPDEQFPPSLGRPSQGPLALALAAGSGGGLDGLGGRSVTRLHDAERCGGCCHGVGAGAPQGGAHGDEQAEGCSRSGSSSGFPPAHDLLNRLSLLLCCRKLLGTALDQRRRKGPVCDTGAFRNCTFSCSSMSVRHSRDGGSLDHKAWTSHDPETVRSPSCATGERLGPSITKLM